MFIEAIVNENIDRDYLILEIGDKISGNVRSYRQNFVKIRECVEVTGETEEELEIIEKEIRVKIKPDSIKKVYCGCGEKATREICNEYLCDECDYEETEDHSYIYQSPWSYD